HSEPSRTAHCTSAESKRGHNEREGRRPAATPSPHTFREEGCSVSRRAANPSRRQGGRAEQQQRQMALAHERAATGVLRRVQRLPERRALPCLGRSEHTAVSVGKKTTSGAAEGCECVPTVPPCLHHHQRKQETISSLHAAEVVRDPRVNRRVGSTFSRRRRRAVLPAGRGVLEVWVSFQRAACPKEQHVLLSLARDLDDSGPRPEVPT
ncbi:unnamed protein product, partial [Ectocarpus sp. 8 AP-2014]